MNKNLRKNKKGFTLVEIIVVLVIMGILLAIAVPSVLGYVNKANDAKYVAEARGGYLAAQTIMADNASRHASEETIPAITIDASAVNTELDLDEGDDGYITNIKCVLADTNKNVTSCQVQVDGLETRHVLFTAGKDGKAEVKDGAIPTE